jgi:hypothetical protein
VLLAEADEGVAPVFPFGLQVARRIRQGDGHWWSGQCSSGLPACSAATGGSRPLVSAAKPCCQVACPPLASFMSAFAPDGDCGGAVSASAVSEQVRRHRMRRACSSRRSSSSVPAGCNSRAGSGSSRRRRRCRAGPASQRGAGDQASRFSGIALEFACWLDCIFLEGRALQLTGASNPHRVSLGTFTLRPCFPESAGWRCRDAHAFLPSPGERVGDRVPRRREVSCSLPACPEA